MQWISGGVVRSWIGFALLTAGTALIPDIAAAQSWTSTDVGAVGLAGGATESNGVWTIRGAGDDIWDRVDAFQFLHKTVTDGRYIEARIDDLQNTDPFAKAGVMVRTSLDANSAMAILDVRPGGQLEFMARTSAAEAVTFLGSQTLSFPAWVRLSWSQGSIRGWVSRDGSNWTFVNNVGIVLPASFEAGVAVTSHDRNQLATAHASHLTVAAQDPLGWYSTDVGDVGQAGSAADTNGTWTARGGGSDIWGTADAFHYVYRPVLGQRHQFFVRVQDLENTSSFAKTGLMLRKSLDPGSATVLLDVRPTGDVEFMARASDGGSMQYLGGVAVRLPVWLKLEWFEVSPTQADSPATVIASVSQNEKASWVEVGRTTATFITFGAGSNPIPPGVTYHAGVAVTSHDATRLTTAHVQGLTLTGPVWRSDDIGGTGLVGSAVNDSTLQSFPFVLEGAGSDIWGTADSFQYLHLLTDSPFSGKTSDRVDIIATNPFAKAGFMYRDGVAPNAAMVVLDVKPGGGVEFMARMCTGCPVTYLAGADMGLPVWLSLGYSGTKFSASATSADGSRQVDLGSVDVTMPNIMPGLAVTSHDPSQIAVGIFANLPPH